MEKEFGKLSIAQIQQILFIRQEFKAKEEELVAAVRENGSRYWAEIVPPYYWATFYDAPFTRLLAGFLVVSGLSEDLQAFSTSPDPQQAVLDAAFVDPERGWDGGFNGQFEQKHLIGYLYAVVRNIDYMSFYGRTSHSLANGIRSGNDRDLFRLVRVDRSALAAPVVGDRLAKAQLEGDEDFFRSLRNAISGVSEKRDDRYDDLRFTLAMLDEDGTLDALTIDQKYDLFCLRLNIYPDREGASAEALEKYINRWKKDFRT